MLLLLGKLALAALLVVCSVVIAVRREDLRALASRLPGITVLCSLYLGVRVVTLWLIHEALHVRVPADVPGYFEHALRVLAGEIPNREFATPYGFVFNYLMAASVWLYRDPFSILVLFQIAECVGLYLLLRAVAAHTGDTRNGVLLLLIYAANPIIAVNLWLGGQDESLLILVLGAAAMLCTARGSLAVTTLPAILFSASKLFCAWILAPLALTRGWRERAGMALALAVLLGLIKHSGAALVSFEFARPQGTSDELTTAQTSGNLWYLLTEVVKLPLPTWVATAAALAALTATGVWLWLRARYVPPLMLVLIGTAALGLCFQICYRMTAPPYLAPAVASIAALLVMRQGSTVALGIWSGLWSFEGTVWFRVAAGLPNSVALRGLFDLYEVVLVVTTIIAFAWTLSSLRSQTTWTGAPRADKVAFR